MSASIAPELAEMSIGGKNGENTKLSKLRREDFPLRAHSHGKSKVRVLKVRRGDGTHKISEWEVAIKLLSPTYERVFNQEDNSDLVATDTQKNTVYIVAKRSNAETCEDFALDLAEHFLKTYPILTGVTAEVSEIPWRRAEVEGKPHAHSFEHPGNERHVAEATADRGEDGNTRFTGLTSSIRTMTVLKTTQSGFEKFLRDEYTLLPDCTERCLSSHVDVWWRYGVVKAGAPAPRPVIDFKKVRDNIRAELCRGIFGPAESGVYSESLQATIYDASCLCLSKCGEVSEIDVSTPNVHYLPVVAPLKAVGLEFENDIFQPTSDPSGSITCTVGRD